jgi:hypothetical protein
MPYRATYKAETDVKIEALIPDAPGYITTKELAAKGFQIGAVRNSLRRLVRAGVLQCSWRMGVRGGHAVYYITPLQGE